MTTDDIDQRRRSIIKWAAAVGLTTVAPGTVSAVAQNGDGGPPEDLPTEPPAQDRDGDVTLTHPIEYEGVRDRVSRAAAVDEPSEIYSDRLERALAAGDRDEYDLQVRTAGRPATVVTERRERQIDGWSPTDGEVQRLSQFGEVGFVPEFTSTTVSLRGVDAEDVPAVADLPFVLTLSLPPAVEPDHPEPRDHDHPQGRYEWSCVDTSTYSSVAELRSDDLLGFESVSDEDNVGPDSTVKIGIIDDGYDPDQPYIYEEHYAADYIDSDLADEFSDKWHRTGDRDDDLENYHGTIVANTVAAMLDAGWEDMIVPIDVRNDDSHDVYEDSARAAIEFATRHDLDVINMSLGYTGEDEVPCQSTFCDELEAYAAAGNVAVTTTGNRGAYWNPEEVGEPGTSRFDISVGGIDQTECDEAGGYERDPKSVFGQVEYLESECEPCHSTGVDEQFAPDVYGVYRVAEDDWDECLNGTSFASPQFAAAALLLKEHGVDDFWTAKEAARAQDATNVCPDDHAKAGQLFDANHVLGHAPPTPPVDPRVEWVSDTAVELSWDPAHSPGEPDVYIYFVSYSSSVGGQSWHVYAPETSIVIDGLAEDHEYDVQFSAGDDWGNQSEQPGPEVVFSTLASEDLVARINPARTELSAGETARFDWTDETDDGNWVPDAPSWDFDDGTTETDWYVEHTYTEPGTYWVTMEATNDEGETTTDFVEITVT